MNYDKIIDDKANQLKRIVNALEDLDKVFYELSLAFDDYGGDVNDLLKDYPFEEDFDSMCAKVRTFAAETQYRILFDAYKK